jgi:hypothetical protein
MPEAPRWARSLGSTLGMGPKQALPRARTLLFWRPRLLGEGSNSTRDAFRTPGMGRTQRASQKRAHTQARPPRSGLLALPRPDGVAAGGEPAERAPERAGGSPRGEAEARPLCHALRTADRPGAEHPRRRGGAGTFVADAGLGRARRARPAREGRTVDDPGVPPEVTLRTAGRGGAPRPSFELASRASATVGGKVRPWFESTQARNATFRRCFEGVDTPRGNVERCLEGTNTLEATSEVAWRVDLPWGSTSEVAWRVDLP